MKIQCETASFRGRGTFACRKCATVTELHTGMSAVLMVLPTTFLVFDAATGTLLHDCAHPILFGDVQYCF